MEKYRLEFMDRKGKILDTEEIFASNSTEAYNEMKRLLEKKRKENEIKKYEEIWKVQCLKYDSAVY